MCIIMLRWNVLTRSRFHEESAWLDGSLYHVAFLKGYDMSDYEKIRNEKKQS